MKRIRQLSLADSIVLKVIFSVVFLVILTPVTYLFVRTNNQIQNQNLLNIKEDAQRLIDRVVQDFQVEVEREENRSFFSYRFVERYDPGGRALKVSELSKLPIKKEIPGLIGYFQINPDESFQTPHYPTEMWREAFDLSKSSERLHLQRTLEAHVRNANFVKLFGENLKNTKDRHDKTTPKTQVRPRNLVGKKGSQSLHSVEDESTYNLYDPEWEHDWADGSVPPEFMGSMDIAFEGKHMFLYRGVLFQGQIYLQGLMISQKEFFGKRFNKYFRNKEALTLKISLPKGSNITLKGWNSKNPVLFNTNLTGGLEPIKVAVQVRDDSNLPGQDSMTFFGIFFFLIFSASFYGIYRVTSSHMAISQKRSDFISAVSHELKTPLTAIRMYSEMLENDMLFDESRRKDYYRRISSEANRLSRLIQNVLSLSRIEKQKWVAEMKSWGLDELVQNYITTFNGSVEAKGYEINADLKADGAVHLLDSDAFTQILVNVVDNAIKFSAGREPKRVDIFTRETATHATLIIRDYGPGVSSAELRNIFKVFYRAENEMTRKTSGTGIGLSLVKNFCTMMHIEIDAKNVNPGLQFTFVLAKEQI